MNGFFVYLFIGLLIHYVCECYNKAKNTKESMPKLQSLDINIPWYVDVLSLLLWPLTLIATIVMGVILAKNTLNNSWVDATDKEEVYRLWDTELSEYVQKIINKFKK